MLGSLNTLYRKHLSTEVCHSADSIENGLRCRPSDLPCLLDWDRTSRLGRKLLTFSTCIVTPRAVGRVNSLQIITLHRRWCTKLSRVRRVYSGSVLALASRPPDQQSGSSAKATCSFCPPDAVAGRCEAGQTHHSRPANQEAENFFSPPSHICRAL